MQQCLAEYQNRNAEAHGWLISGDFNVTPESEIVELALRTGMQYPHHNLADVYTCNIGGRARLIDYLFYSAELTAEASVVNRIVDQTICRRGRTVGSCATMARLTTERATVPSRVNSSTEVGLPPVIPAQSLPVLDTGPESRT